MRRLDDDDDYEIINGHPVLKDGRRARFGIMMRDGMTPLQRAIAEAATGASLHDGHGGTAMLGRKPGWVTTVEAEKIRRDAYEASKAALQDAWRTPAAPSVRSDAAPPPDPRQPISFSDSQKIRDTAYLEMCHELANAWRGT
jgi:hypothetical protein